MNNYAEFRFIPHHRELIYTQTMNQSDIDLSSIAKNIVE